MLLFRIDLPLRTADRHETLSDDDRIRKGGAPVKTRKRLLALLLAMLLLFSLLPAYAAAEPDTSEAGDDENAPPVCEHTPGEPVIENVVTPGCTEPGSHDEVVYCSLCEKELSRETVEDPAGHKPGEPVTRIVLLLRSIAFFMSFSPS